MCFEELRRQVQQIHTKPIKDLESIPAGVAQFETLIEDYEAAGGIGYESDLIKKSDLLNILPTRMQSDLLWHSTNPKESFAEFRDHILVQSARVLGLERRRRGGVNAINEQEDRPPPLGTSAAEDEAEDGNPITSLEDLLAMVNRSRQRPGGQRGDKQERRQGPRGDGDRQRGPRKCANCGK